MKLLRLFAPVALCAAGLAAPAQAANIFYDGVPKWQAPGSAFSTDLRGRALYDVADGGQDYRRAIPDIGDSEWRTFRVGADWVFSDTLKATTEFDLANDDFQPTDLFLAWTPRAGLTLQFGQFKEAFSIDELTSSRFITFMERGSVTDYTDLARRFGAQIAFSGDNWSFTTALQGAPMDGFRIVDGIRGVTSRASFAPVLTDTRYVHLAAALRYRDSGDAAAPLLRFRQRPLARLSVYTVATPRFAESEMTYGLEAATGLGPFHAAAEYAFTNAQGPVSDADFSAFYAAAGWFVTGEHKNYLADHGKFDRMSPLKDFGRGGFGALELLVRYDTVDLSDGAIVGGEQDSVTFGATWYATSRARIMLNYVDADVENGPYGDGDSSIVESRFQIDW